MAEPKIKPAKREAGRSKFRLPERAPRPAEENPLRELLKEAKAQEEALEPKTAPLQDTPAKKIAGVRKSAAARLPETPVISRAATLSPVATGSAGVTSDSTDL